MNPYLKAKRDQYETMRAEVSDLQTRAADERRDLTDDELRTITERTESMRSVAAEIERMTELETRSEAIAKLAANVLGGGAGDATAEDVYAPYSLLPSSAQLDELRSAIGRGERHYRVTHGRVSRDDVHTRALVGAADVGGPIRPLSGMFPEPRRIVTTVGLVPEPVDSGGASGAKFGATSGQSPTDEGGTKPEADAVTPLSIVPQALARWTDVSRHALLSSSGFLAQLTAWHGHAIAKDEDLMVVTALTTAAGTPIGTGDAAADVRTAVAMVTDAVSADADIVLCNPADYAEVSAFTPANSSDVASYADRIARAVIYPTSAVAAETVLVAAVRAGGRFVVAEAPSVVGVEAPKVNTTTVRTEELAGFGVRLNGSVVAIDLTPGV